MKLLVLSDLHLEFSNFQPAMEADEADLVVLAGDIWLNDYGIHWARSTWPDHEIVYVAGNHEFYKRQHGDVLKQLQDAAAETGVHFLNDQEVMIQGVRFLGATLWTDFMLLGEKKRRESMIHARRMNDFRIIRNGNRALTARDSVEFFKQSVAFLEQKLVQESYSGKTVVVTHHLPSQKSVADRFRFDEISPAFASNLDHLLPHADVWIHGHTHDSFDYVADGCRVVCNPRGYSTANRPVENPSFNPGLLIEI